MNRKIKKKKKKKEAEFKKKIVLKEVIFDSRDIHVTDGGMVLH